MVIQKIYIPKLLAVSVPFLATLGEIFPKIGMSRIKTPPDCIILDNWVFENFMLADEPFAKPLKKSWNLWIS